MHVMSQNQPIHVRMKNEELSSVTVSVESSTSTLAPSYRKTTPENANIIPIKNDEVERLQSLNVTVTVTVTALATHTETVTVPFTQSPYIDTSKITPPCSSSDMLTFGLHSDTIDGWKRRRHIFLAQHAKQINMPLLGGGSDNWGGSRSHGPTYFQDNWEPSFSCPYEMRIGHWGDGGKWICNPHRIRATPVVYSLGSRNEYSFEHGINHEFNGNVEIHTFDLSSPVNTPSFVNFHQWFITGTPREYMNPPHMTLMHIIESLAHTHVDIFKIDIEGSELDVLMPLLESDRWPSAIEQMQIEVHLMPGETTTTPSGFDKFFTLLSEKANMHIFHKEPNIKFAGGAAVEYSLVKVDWDIILPFLSETD